MTELLPSFAQSLAGRSSFDHLADSAEQYWQQPQYNHLPMLTAQWPHTSAPYLSGIQQLDLNDFERDKQEYGLLGGSQAALLSPDIGYHCSDVDTAGTPSTTGFPDTIDSYPIAQAPTSYRLQLPEHMYRNAGLMHSPHSSHRSVSPREDPLPSPGAGHVYVRPTFDRAFTAPEPRDCKPATSSNGLHEKHKGTSDEEEDEEFVPSEGTGPRSRKRQRIPHTAVERRYRENLNAHLDRLRQTVPSLAARKGPSGKGADGSEGVKPSKCEILNGAIEHVMALDKQMVELRNENLALRARMDQMQSWYCNNAR